MNENIKNFLQNLKQILEDDDFTKLDEILESLMTWIYSEEEVNEMWDILSEATLYTEFKESDYKEEALRLINEELGE